MSGANDQSPAQIKTKGIAVLKIISSSLISTLFIASQSPAFSFDSARFYSNDIHPADFGGSEVSVEEPSQKDTFGLAPSGRIDRVSSDTISNTNGSSIPESSLPTDTSGTNAKPIRNLNTSYSDARIAHGSMSECGPSPMTASEIEELVARTAQAYGVDPGLAKAITWAESRFDRNRNSEQGARGPMQLMPATASELGVREICDPVSNIDGGIRHLKLMLEEFQNPILAAAAYNAGAQAVYDNGGVPPFSETVRYVAAVINHQMGLQIPLKNRARGNSAGIGSPSANEMASDVIGARGSRFIKGVMQF
ncbi:lytic transglycosylase domain-containing protein [Neorhizobium alkalisoli]|uniref:lytic transglycosylase domain-containing protein n=1 Tax=Neorhizobium alkalisoli TaxID=528178 RepID=UPI001FE236C7|nr:lytic transglycosylase domain-containing protein [Neorhizobium alkalisoli]